MRVKIGPTGRLSKGHVLDVNVKPFEEALRAHDRDLYVKWNPNKLRGWGCWEIRRKPLYKIPTDIVRHEGMTIVRLEAVENEMLHHVLDCAFLNYDQIRKIKEMDTWTNPDHFLNDLEYKETTQRNEILQRAKDELAYSIKQHKSVFAHFRDLVQSGKNPARIVMGADV